MTIDSSLSAPLPGNNGEHRDEGGGPGWGGGTHTPISASPVGRCGHLGCTVFVQGGGLPRVSKDVWLHPWPLPTRCQQHPPPICDRQKCPQRVEQPQLRNRGLRSSQQAALAVVTLWEAGPELSLPVLPSISLYLVLASDSSFTKDQYHVEETKPRPGPGLQLLSYQSITTTQMVGLFSHSPKDLLYGTFR